MLNIEQILLEKIICSSLSLVESPKDREEPLAWRSGLIGQLGDSFFVITVVHHFDFLKNILLVENPEFWNQVPFKLFQISGGISWKVFYHKENDPLTKEKFIKELSGAEDVDLYYAQVDFQSELLQLPIDIESYHIDKQPKMNCDLNDLSDLSPDKKYGTYGYRKPSIDGIRILKEGFLVYPLTYTYENYDYLCFKSVLENAQPGDYEGLSGAPILDEEGKLAGIFTGYQPDSHVVWGLKASKVVEFIIQSEEIRIFDENNKFLKQKAPLLAEP